MSVEALPTADDATATTEPGSTDPDDIAAGDEVDITWNFGSDIPGALVTLIDAVGTEGWDLSGLTITVNPDGTLTVTGTAKTPGSYAIDVLLEVNGVPVTKQLLLTIHEWRKGSSGCAAGAGGLFAVLLAIPLVWRKRR